MAAIVLARVPDDLRAAGRPESAGLVAAFCLRDDSLLSVDDVRNAVQFAADDCVPGAAHGQIRSVLDVLRLLDEFR